MVPASNLKLIAENLSEQSILQAIFQPERARGEIETSSYMLPDAAVSGAVLSLLQSPDLPVALVLNVQGADPTPLEEREAPIRRMLGEIAPPKDWHLALADPDVDAWLWADPRLSALFHDDEAARQSRYERAARVGDLARAVPIDREAIARVHPEFRELLTYIERHCPVVQPTA